MRVAGEPIFECEFTPGSDIMGETTSGPYAAELMEFQLFSRLAQENWSNIYVYGKRDAVELDTV